MTGGGIKYTNYKKEKQVAMEKTKSPRESRPVEDVFIGEKLVYGSGSSWVLEIVAPFIGVVDVELFSYKKASDCLVVLQRLVVADLMKRRFTIKERRRMSGMDYCRM
ncbi:hypothetical protein DKX38_006146 [Salix brachista]|uniref:Uncharacterized protein n=1 Tax=Salix brachista TaxID=2182728 RepID=A0A5N5N1I0_9ROSI|nr:hypothetical protein DKX38_006146 [Salix brachista]